MKRPTQQVIDAFATLLVNLARSQQERNLCQNPQNCASSLDAKTNDIAGASVSPATSKHAGSSKPKSRPTLSLYVESDGCQPTEPDGRAKTSSVN